MNERVNGSLSVTRAFGDHFLKAPVTRENIVSNVPHLSTISLQPQADPFVILGCDGIFDVVSDQEAVNLVYDLFSVQTESSTRSGIC